MTALLSCSSAELVAVLQGLPGDIAVGMSMRRIPAQFSSVTASELRQLLHDDVRETVVVVFEDELYVMRLVPPIVVVRRPSKLYGRIAKLHPGGLYLFRKAVLESVISRLAPSEHAGEIVTAEQSWSPETVTANALLTRVRASRDTMPIFGEEEALVFLFPRAGPNQTRFVSVGHDSVLMPHLKPLVRQG